MLIYIFIYNISYSLLPVHYSVHQRELEFEEKLQSVQRSAVSSHNVDVYKRKLAAQRMEHMQEIQRLNQQISSLQYAASRGGRGRKR